MAKRYFELKEDVYIPKRWIVDCPVDAQGQEVNPWLLRSEQPPSVDGPMRISLLRAGKPMDFSMTPIGTAPVVHARIASLLRELAPQDVQLLPVNIEGQTEPYFLVNTLRTVKCIDDEKSEEVSHWKAEDGRPEKTGKYRSVSGMRIAPERVGEAQVFRPWGWEVVLLVSEDVKQALERVGATGQKFEEVTGPSPISSEERARRRWTRERHEQAMAAREAVWRSQGNLDDEVTLLVVGGDWPSGSAVWKVIHRPQGRTLLVTDGLSDPFSEEKGISVGFGLELALETDAVMKKVRTSWPFKLLERVSNEVAAHEHVRERMKAGLFSMEVSGKGLPRSLLSGEGRVGVLLGMEARTLPAHFTLPAGEVSLVTVKALLPTELDYVLERGAEGQAELARRFAANGEDHVSSVRRSPRGVGLG